MNLVIMKENIDNQPIEVFLDEKNTPYAVYKSKKYTILSELLSDCQGVIFFALLSLLNSLTALWKDCVMMSFCNPMNLKTTMNTESIQKRKSLL